MIALLAAELSLGAARALLDERHYGLGKVKQRIVQYVAVRRLRGADARAPILCFVGPPGVGKTSLARSVAQVRSVSTNIPRFDRVLCRSVMVQSCGVDKLGNVQSRQHR